MWTQQSWHTGLVVPSMWNHPRPGIEPVFSALVGGFLTTRPAGKSPPKGYSVTAYKMLSVDFSLTLSYVEYIKCMFKLESKKERQVKEI